MMYGSRGCNRIIAPVGVEASITENVFVMDLQARGTRL